MWFNRRVHSTIQIDDAGDLVIVKLYMQCSYLKTLSVHFVTCIMSIVLVHVVITYILPVLYMYIYLHSEHVYIYMSLCGSYLGRASYQAVHIYGHVS